MIKGWQERTIGACDKVVITPHILRYTTEISEACRIHSDSEQGGYLGGILEGNIFYATNISVNSYSSWHRLRLKDDHGRERSFFMEAERQGLEFKTLPFHSHPGDDPKQRAAIPSNWVRRNKDYFDQIEKQVAQGMFGNLSVVDVVNEDMRQLSAEDIDNIPGNFQMLISPTYKLPNPFSHLQVYRIGSDRNFPEIREVKGKIPIVLCDEADKLAERADTLQKRVDSALQPRYQKWFDATQISVGAGELPYQEWTKLGYYLDIAELERLSLTEARKIAKQREDEESRLDAEVLHEKIE